MTFKQRRNIAVLAIIALVIAIGYYFLTHSPVGTFKYSSQNTEDLQIRIRCSESLLIFQDPIYNMDITFEQNGKKYSKEYTTSDDLIYFALLSKNNQKFVIIHDYWKGYVKCENGSCGDFFYVEDISYAVNNSTHDTTYFNNYSDTLKADTLSYVEFRDFKFKKLK